jgi:hypothetical protein
MEGQWHIQAQDFQRTALLEEGDGRLSELSDIVCLGPGIGAQQGEAPDALRRLARWAFRRL